MIITMFTFFTFFFLLFHTSIYAARTPQNATTATVTVVRNINATTTKTPPTTIKIKLIPRDSIFPPAIVKTDYNDYDYENDESVLAFLSPDEEENIFLASIQIGEPSVPLLMLPDTGSGLTFVKSTVCIGCEGTALPPYDPSASSTYKHIPCNSKYCRRVKGSGYSCGLMGQCTFRNSYGSGQTIVEGDLGTEKLRFITYDQGITTIPDAVIGCTTSYESISTISTISGVLGLAYDEISVLKKMVSPKFSYCVGSIFDGDYKYNHIILGKGAKMLGYSTPLRVTTVLGRYFITLEGISVGGKRLDIDPEIFKPIRSGGGDGVAIDTGTSFTYLIRKAYEALKSEIKNILDDFQLADDRQMCYRGIISNLKGFPVVTFHFAQEAVLLLDVESIFVPHTMARNIFCLAVRPSDTRYGTLTLIGIIAQQKHNVAYDLTQMRLYIDRIDCKFVDD